MKQITIVAVATAAFLTFGAHAAFADDCTGHDHSTGTVVGGVGGAAIGGLASHSVVGAVAGGVVGALAGNAIDRAQDCDHAERHAAAQEDRAYEAGRADASTDAYEQGRADAAAEGHTQAYDQGYTDRAAQDHAAARADAP